VLEPEPFIPQGAERDGDLIRLPVVFPDGSRATLVYPIPLDLATLGVQPDLSYVWDGYFPIVFIHDPDASIDAFVDPAGPVRFVNTSAGGLEIWRAQGNDVKRRFWMRFDLPSWTVLVSVRDALEAAVTVAGGLDKRRTRDSRSSKPRGRSPSPKASVRPVVRSWRSAMGPRNPTPFPSSTPGSSFRRTVVRLPRTAIGQGDIDRSALATGACSRASTVIASS
jgi:hypothetical protein